MEDLWSPPAKDGTARLWEAATGKAIGEPLRHDDGVLSAAFSPDGRFVVTASMDGTARLWEAATGKAIGEPLRHDDERFERRIQPGWKICGHWQSRRDRAALGGGDGQSHRRAPAS